MCVVNPEGKELDVTLPQNVAMHLQGDVLFEIGDISLREGIISIGAQSFAVIK